MTNHQASVDHGAVRSTSGLTAGAHARGQGECVRGARVAYELTCGARCIPQVRMLGQAARYRWCTHLRQVRSTALAPPAAQQRLGAGKRAVQMVSTGMAWLVCSCFWGRCVLVPVALLIHACALAYTIAYWPCAGASSGPQGQ
jgi:hypothetical protein